MPTPRSDAGPRTRLTPKQQEATLLLGGPARHVMLYGGSRSGKTFALVRALIVRAAKAPESRHAIFRHRFNHIKTSVIFDTFPKVSKLCFPDLRIAISKTDWIARLPNGSEIYFCGLDDKERTEKVLGQEFATLYFNECSQISWDSVLMASTRLAQKTGLKLKAYYDCNPPGTQHWTARAFVDRRDPKTRAPLRDGENYVSLVMNPDDNRENLAPEYLDILDALPDRQRRRFKLGLFTGELDNALWTYESVDGARGRGMKLGGAAAASEMCERVIVSVDPSGASGAEDKRSDEIGIVVAGRIKAGHYVVLADRSMRGSPAQWARAAIRAYHEFRADTIVAEVNFGGEMVRHTLQTEDPHVPVEVVHHSRGKAVRAEPVSNLYAKGEVDHADTFTELEDQMVNMTTAGYMGDRSPDRLDAAVWALSELSLGQTVQYYGMV
ncbi:MAG: phage terminase large subunit [Hyphomicrobium sp.]|nr:phage terminase large subunit [Hyphomicrobium sp.]